MVLSIVNTISFICTQLNGPKHVALTIEFILRYLLAHS